MKDGELDRMYVEKREQLKQLVASIIRPKIVQGKTLNGKEFVSFLEQVPFFSWLSYFTLSLFSFGYCKLGMRLLKLPRLGVPKAAA